VTLAAELGRGVETLHIPLTADGQRNLLAYIALLQKWNRVHNLTAVRDADQMLTHHLLDSLAVVPHINGERILDVGSGAGLPGIPIAFALPRAHVTLLDSNHKKSTFLSQSVIELGLPNVTVVHERVERWQPADQFDIVISRAFADLAEFVALAGRHCRDEGVLAAMKGVYPFEEIRNLPPGYAVREVIALDVPGLDAKRHLVLIGRA
jgi:16S rRNA (guanine527-N7)-methyltransferase